jgi:hypothetical protein
MMSERLACRPERLLVAETSDDAEAASARTNGSTCILVFLAEVSDKR